jgi:Protein of unknown function (DUF3593)
MQMVVHMQTLGEVLAPQLFALSLWPYLGFLYHLTKGCKASAAPKIMVFGFYFLLVFVFVTIPAGIYAKQAYGTSLSNVDWLHGSAESMLTVTNLLIGAAQASCHTHELVQCSAQPERTCMRISFVDAALQPCDSNVSSVGTEWQPELADRVMFVLQLLACAKL